MKRRIGLAIVAGCCAVASPALARDQQLDIPAGTLSQAIAALGSQARVSVVVAVNDPALWQRPVAAVRGRISAERALAILLRDTGARAVAASPGVWRVVTAPRPMARASRAVFRRAAPVPPIPQSRDDIVITSSKRDMRLDGYPGAVTVLGGTDLGRDGESGSDAVLSRVTTVSSTYLGAGRNKLFIRGIADSSFTGPTQATVGQYFGDVRLTYNAPDPDLRLYDVESVEILEGPQGTLYGAGSLGGIIRIRRNTPDLDQIQGMVTGGMSATWHGAPGGDLAGMVNLPIVPGAVGLRAVAYGITEGGYIDDPIRRKNDVNRSNIAGGRAMVRSDLAGWTVDLGGTFQKIHNLDSQYADAADPPLTRSSRLAQGSDATYALGEAVASRRIGDLLFLSSLGVARQRLDERYDASLPKGPERLFRQRNRTNLFSFESRLSRPMENGLGWVAGISFVRNSTELTRALGPPDMPVPATGVTNRISEVTGYGEVSVELIPHLILTGGSRYSRAWLTGEGQDVMPFLAQANLAVTAGRAESAFLPSIALSATPIDHLTLYARYQESFRPGGLAIENDFVRRFLNDRAATMEIGIRRGAPETGRVDLALSASHTVWRNIQADYIDAHGLPSTANIGDGRIWSLSATAGWMPVKGLRVEGGASVNDSRITNPNLVFFTLARLTPASLGPTRQVPNIANVVARGSVKYDVAVSIGAQLSLAASARYTGKSRLGVGPVLGASQGDYVDTRVSARLSFEKVAVTLSATNLTDEIGNRFALGTPFALVGEGQITPLRPRTVRLGFDAAF